jgi:hypothetical protein
MLITDMNWIQHASGDQLCGAIDRCYTNAGLDAVMIGDDLRAAECVR